MSGAARHSGNILPPQRHSKTNSKSTSSGVSPSSAAECVGSLLAFAATKAFVCVVICLLLLLAGKRLWGSARPFAESVESASSSAQNPHLEFPPVRILHLVDASEADVSSWKSKLDPSFNVHLWTLEDVKKVIQEDYAFLDALALFDMKDLKAESLVTKLILLDKMGGFVVDRGLAPSPSASASVLQSRLLTLAGSGDAVFVRHRGLYLFDSFFVYAPQHQPLVSYLLRTPWTSSWPRSLLPASRYTRPGNAFTLTERISEFATYRRKVPLTAGTGGAVSAAANEKEKQKSASEEERGIRAVSPSTLQAVGIAGGPISVGIFDDSITWILDKPATCLAVSIVCLLTVMLAALFLVFLTESRRPGPRESVWRWLRSKLRALGGQGKKDSLQQYRNNGVSGGSLFNRSSRTRAGTGAAISRERERLRNTPRGILTSCARGGGDYRRGGACSMGSSVGTFGGDFYSPPFPGGEGSHFDRQGKGKGRRGLGRMESFCLHRNKTGGGGGMHHGAGSSLLSPQYSQWRWGQWGLPGSNQSTKSGSSSCSSSFGKSKIPNWMLLAPVPDLSASVCRQTQARGCRGRECLMGSEGLGADMQIDVDHENGLTGSEENGEVWKKKGGMNVLFQGEGRESDDQVTIQTTLSPAGSLSPSSSSSSNEDRSLMTSLSAGSGGGGSSSAPSSSFSSFCSSSSPAGSDGETEEEEEEEEEETLELLGAVGGKGTSRQNQQPRLMSEGAPLIV
uniref:Transmembrane protein n=1 Tax=Chromera velia CCMP2878 TaxID=1169474 RepID=A0A0G4FXA4_9ALVE|eukprot:Cvel_19242.t1-p1 / transcript=Cvel_19242.t1 / gene=Cvel_19242 / organism=Chromera_velia_CCMP2878 / gene_product=hypothetical protein / transcript_product=hypothetical protein / location=Cvel_scaffold1645:29224-31922(+) / protein_length=736 / sequence_SO=supercontig / SO=protein_coding / is_pseudo=false